MDQVHNVTPDLLTKEVKVFLQERGCLLDESDYLFIDSLDYLALIMHLETHNNINIKESIFFAEGMVEQETLANLCQRLLDAASSA